jgi:ATP-dependent Clp protease protease subunit
MVHRIEDWDLEPDKVQFPSMLEERIDTDLLSKGIILLYGELNEENCHKVCKKLIYIKECMKTKTVKIILNSIGGEVYHGLLIYNTIQDLVKSGIKVNIEARGLCASMGVIILVAGSHKSASKYTRFLLHEVSGSFEYGKTSELKEQSAELEKLNKILDELVASKSKLSVDKLQKITRKKDLWISAEDALRYGLIEEIV